MYSPPTIRTKFLIISDTHGRDSSLQHLSTERADVAIHCGDLTTDSTLAEFRSSIALLSSLNAPLKLVIAGNHDFTLDTPAFQRKLAKARLPLDKALVGEKYGDFGYARSLFEDETDNGIIFLDQGTHHFALANGASLTVYASPYTPCSFPGKRGFEYSRLHGHNFEFEHVDVAITHGPPKGIMDYTLNRERAGCPRLFAAVRRAKPRMHCFGHIHEQWGAKLVTWKKGSPTRKPCYFGDVDYENTFVIERRLNLQGEEESVQGRFYRTSHCTGDRRPLKWEEQTLFVNAAVGGINEEIQPAWLVEIELFKAF
ncbi:metallophosphatase domain-containing protein [Aspergillus melleus]|uniref:metallophosphatase domain-containing protein n=1 Tax=Aspergillus melleus TaxID=138277 RepID=UPI001E8D0692|nr:uncharacterized protein LDX57_010096 [Aspergillus melleus]KAH8432461.1 hypothetical protein LDX57_010096 [Aspergillus melleus]